MPDVTGDSCAGLCGFLTSWKDIKNKQKTYNIQHTTLYKLFFFLNFCFFFFRYFSWNNFPLIFCIFIFSSFFSLSVCFFSPRRSAQRRTKEHRSIWGLPTTIDRAHCNRFVNGRTSGHEDDGDPMSRRQLLSDVIEESIPSF